MIATLPFLLLLVKYYSNTNNVLIIAVKNLFEIKK